MLLSPQAVIPSIRDDARIMLAAFAKIDFFMLITSYNSFISQNSTIALCNVQKAVDEVHIVHMNLKTERK